MPTLTVTAVLRTTSPIVCCQLTLALLCPPTHPFSPTKAREAIDLRSQMEKKLAQKERESKEDNLRQLAQKARDERAGIRTADDGKHVYHALSSCTLLQTCSNTIFWNGASFCKVWDTSLVLIARYCTRKSH